MDTNQTPTNRISANAWLYGPRFKFLSSGMGTSDYMHRSGVRYRHPCGQPETLYYFTEPAPANVAADWAEYQETERLRFVEWCQKRNIEIPETHRASPCPT